MPRDWFLNPSPDYVRTLSNGVLETIGARKRRYRIRAVRSLGLGLIGLYLITVWIWEYFK